MALPVWLQRLLTPHEFDPRSGPAEEDAFLPGSRAFPWRSQTLDRVGRILSRTDGSARQEPEQGHTRRTGQGNEAKTVQAARPGSRPDLLNALGGLLRDRGDFDQAVRLRETLLSAPELGGSLKAETLFELGRDFKQAGLLDRAVLSYREARKNGYPQRSVDEELCRLFADSGDYGQAAECAAQLHNLPAQAFYLVRQAEEDAAGGDDAQAVKRIKSALVLYPGSPEARLCLARIYLMAGEATKALQETRIGLSEETDPARLILLEGLHAFVQGTAAPNIAPEHLRRFFIGLGDALADLPPSLTLYYYAGLFFRFAGFEHEAEQWFTKCLVLDPVFWAARLALLSSLGEKEHLSPLLAEHIAFFSEAGSRCNRFICPPCGLRRDTIFSQCPRCRAWHSAAFRLRLT